MQEKTDPTLPQDGERLEGTLTWRTRRVVHVRVGEGRGLEGRWREPAQAAPAPPAGGRGHLAKAVEPYWIISSDRSGLMTWTIPRTGEVLVGKADGKSHPIRDR